MNSKKSVFKQTPTKALIVLLAVLLLGGAIYTVKNRFFDSKPAENPGTVDTINYNPPTDEEKKAADEQKKSAEGQQKKDDQLATQPQGGNNSVEPIITSTGQYNDDQYGNRIEVRAFIPGVYEAGGTCTVTFTSGSMLVTRTAEGIKDVSTTRCDTVTIPRAEFPASGSWTVIVKYASTTSSGSSKPTIIEVN